MHKRVRIKVPVHSLVHLFAGVGEVTQKSVVFSWIERTENEISIITSETMDRSDGRSMKKAGVR